MLNRSIKIKNGDQETTEERLRRLQNNLQIHLIDLETYLCYCKHITTGYLNDGNGEAALIMNDVVKVYIDQIDELQYIFDDSFLRVE